MNGGRDPHEMLFEAIWLSERSNIKIRTDNRKGITMKPIYVVVCCLLPLLVGCTTNSPVKEEPKKVDIKNSKLYLSEEIIAKNLGNIEGLYDSWISPHTKIINGRGSIEHENDLSTSLSQSAVKDGFTRFCLASSGLIELKDSYFGQSQLCYTNQRKFVGELMTHIQKGNRLDVDFDSPERLAKRDEKERAFMQSLASNGPTGEILTDTGRFSFLRIGDLNERHMVEIELRKDKTEYIPIEEVSRIDFADSCCDLNVTFKNGQQETINKVYLKKRTSLNSVSNYGLNGLPFVLIDSESGQPYTSLYPNLQGLRSIKLDDRSIWAAQKGGKISTSFNPVSASSLTEYTKTLRSKANILYSEAESKGWLKLLPNGKLTQRLMDYLKGQLVGMTSNSACSGDPASGIRDMQVLLRCRVAAKEFTLLMKDDYSIITDISPLSSIIIIEKIKADVQ